jgi:hypothetical protein
MKHYLGICLVLVTVAVICVIALHSCTSAINGTVDHIRDAFSAVLHVQPQVTINQRVLLSQTAPIAELAVVTKEELVTIGFDEHLEVLSMQIPLTEKKLTAEATFRLKAGFDLRKPFLVTIDPAMHELHATMPRAQILSVEQIGDLRLKGDDAMLNKVTDADRTQILSSLNDAAHNAAENSGLNGEAEQQVTARLNELMTHNGQKLQIEWKNEPSTSSQVP